MRVLFAHQSTIPHYRVPFYNSLEQLRPRSWCFDVVFDPLEITKKQYFKDDLDIKEFKFPTLNVKTYTLKLGVRTLAYQSFWLRGKNYDLIVLEDAINNLTYPLSKFHQITGTKIAYWGLGKDRKVQYHNPLTYTINLLKLCLNRSSDGYFAYTQGVKDYLISQGIDDNKIFPINNTIDIDEHRSAYESVIRKKDNFKEKLGVKGKKVLLFVSTFKASKRPEFLLDAFSKLVEIDNDFHLLLVGGGGENYSERFSGNISYFGSVTGIQELVPIYTVSDLFTYPGQVGLAPLQAICYDVPVITIDSDYNHGPEIEYLNTENSIILNKSTNPKEFALEIKNLFDNKERLERLKMSSWSSIKHLTIENMANNFIFGINTILGL